MSVLTPINGHILIKPIEESDEMIGNIILPDMGKEKPEVGEVIEVSDTYNWHTGEYYRSKLKAGDKVLVPKMGSQKVSFGMEDYYITRESEILGILN